MLAFLILFILVLAYFHPLLSASFVFVERDLAPFFIPPRLLWITLIKSFEFPLWNPYNYSGIPLLATLQPGILYPPNLLFLFLPFPVAWNWLIILHFVFSGFTTYYLLRYLKVSTLSSFAGGIIFMLSGYLLSVHSLLPHLLAVGWFPLVLLYFIKHYETGRYRNLVLSCFCLTLEFLAGAPEMVMLTLFVLCVIAIYPTPFLYGDPPNWFKRLSPFIFLLIMFLLVSAIQLIPFYELKIHSIRSTSIPYTEAITWSLSWRDFILFFLPDAFGYGQTEVKYWANQSWLKTVYLGVIPFIMSLFFFCSNDRKRLVFFLFMLISVIFALGGNTPLYKLLYNLPPFNAIRYPVKFLFLFFFVIAVTSAFGFDILKSTQPENDKRVKRIVVVCFYVGFIFAGFWGYINLFGNDVRTFLDLRNFKPDQYNEIWFNLHNLKRFLLFSFLFCVTLLIYLRFRRMKYVMYGMVFLLIADLFLANYGNYTRISWKVFESEHKFTSLLSKAKETERYFVTNKTNAKLGQYFPTDRAILNTPYAPIFGLYTIGGSEILKVAHYNLFFDMLLGTATLKDAKRFIDIAGIRFMITSYKVDDPDFKLRDYAEIGGNTAYLYEYLRNTRRFLLFGRVYRATNDQEVVTKLLDNNIDLRKELIIFSKEKLPNIIESQVFGRVTLLSYKPNKVVMESQSDSSGFLYISDTYYPGWRAYVDGKETKIYRANLAFRAVEVPKGRHTVVFRYVPISFYIGLALTLFGIALCVWLWRRDKKGGEGFKA